MLSGTFTAASWEGSTLGQMWRFHDYLVWREIGKIGIYNDRKQSIPCEVISKDGELKTGIDQVLSEWRIQYEDLYGGQMDCDFDEDHMRYVAEELERDNFTPNNNALILNRPIEKSEVKRAIDRAKLNKATGIDAIPAEALKNPSCVDLLLPIIKACFEQGAVPECWKTGIINPILKPNSTDIRKPLTYRGITLLSVPCKIYCDILNQRLTEFLEDGNILADEQNGFRKKRSCQEHIHSLYSIVNSRKKCEIINFWMLYRPEEGIRHM